MRPERPLLTLAACWFALGIAAALFDPARPVAIVAGGLLLAAAGVDLLRARTAPAISGTREVASTLALRARTRVTLTLENDTRRRARCDVIDHVPPTMQAEAADAHVVLGPGTTATHTYRLRPLERGPADFGPIELMHRSPWGLWSVRRLTGRPEEVHVYPDFRGVRRFAILALPDASGALGVRRRKRRGEGLELHQLREYREGDSFRQIDWKATSRRRQPISREYQDERNQQIVFLLDCGRNMRALDEGRPHFDAALDAVLSLAYVAVRQGDAVGLMTVASEPRWLAPRRGPAATSVLLRGLYDLETGTDVPDFTVAATSLMTRQRRRALVVVVSSLRDEDGAELLDAVRLLRRRHLVLVASLRETVLDETLARPVRDFDAALRHGALHHYLDARRHAFAALGQSGALTVDVTPPHLAVSLVDRYLEIKRSGVL